MFVSKEIESYYIYVSFDVIFSPSLCLHISSHIFFRDVILLTFEADE